MNPYILKVTIAALVLFGITWWLDRFVAVSFVGPMSYGLLLFFYVFAIVAVWLSRSALQHNNHRRFLTALSGSMVAKVLLTAVAVLLFALVDRPANVLVVLPMFVYYSVFTVLEVIEFLRLNRVALEKKVG